MFGFVNGLAIIIFMSELDLFKTTVNGETVWQKGTPLYILLGLVGLIIAIMVLLPRLTKAVPSSLVAILVVFAIVVGFNTDTKTVGDIASISGGFPPFHIPAVPFTLETLNIIFPYAAIMAGVGLIVRNIMHEDSLNTFIVLTDEAFENEYNKIEKFYATSSEDSTRNLTSWNLVKDLTFKGVYTPENLPDTLVSFINVKVPIDKSAIVSSYRTSNGIVYVMNKVDFLVKHKLQPIIVEGESAARPDDFRTDQRNDRIHFRYRPAASNNYDLRVFSHGYRDGIWVRYRLTDLPAGTYKFYMRGTKDFGSAPLKQKLALDSVQSETFAYVTIPMNQQEEVYLGEHTVNQYGKLDMYVVSNMVSGDDLNPIVLDYIKLVPVF